MCVRTDSPTPIPSRTPSAPVLWSNTLQPSPVSSFLIHINPFPCFHDHYRIITDFCTFSLPLVFSSKPVPSFSLHCHRRSHDFWQRKGANFIAIQLIPLQNNPLFPPYPPEHNLEELAGPERYVVLQVSTERCLPSAMRELIQLSQEEQSTSGNTAKTKHAVLVGKSARLFCVR